MSLDHWDDSKLAQAIDQGEAILVDLQASWCPQCGPQEGVVKRVAPEFDGQITFGKINVEQYPAVLETYGIRGLPTLLLFNQGEFKGSMSGFKRAPLIRIALKKLINS